MRRNDREIREMDEIFDVLQRCDTVRIGIQGISTLMLCRFRLGQSGKMNRLPCTFTARSRG